MSVKFACEKCGHYNVIGAQRCEHCRTKLQSKPTRSRPKSDPEPVQPLYPPGRQCPHCGGYKIGIQKEESHGDYKSGSLGAAIHNSTFLYLLSTILVIALCITIVGVPLAWLLNKAIEGQGYRETFKSCDYACSLCGYTWHWSNLVPWPVVNERPELVALGEQRLQQQRQQQQDAEALYYLTHQDK